MLIVGSLIFSSYPFLVTKPQFQPYKDAGYYFANEATTTVQDEYLPVWVKEKSFGRAENKVEIVKGRGKIESLISQSNSSSFIVKADTETQVRINTIYWPGWQITVDGKLSKISYNNPKGLMELAVPKGKHYVEISFEETPLRLFSDGISLFSLFALLSIAFVKKKK